MKHGKQKVSAKWVCGWVSVREWLQWVTAEQRKSNEVFSRAVNLNFMLVSFRHATLAIFGFSYFDFYQKHCTSIYVKLLNSTSCKGEVMPLSCLRLLRWSIFASTLIFIQFNVALPSFRDWFVMILLTTRLFVWQHYSTQISPWATCSWWSMSVNYLYFNDRMNFDVQCSVV